ncbi:MAG: hypothetical protein ACTSPJ_07540 [Candidatus Heimdallarchaeaceae archaeon]
MNLTTVLKQTWTCGGRRKQSTTTFTRVIAMYFIHPGRLYY